MYKEFHVSRRTRAELETLGVEAIRGWQTDQDLFDEAAAEWAGINRTDARCLDILDRKGPMSAGQLAAEVRLTSGAVTAVLDRLEAIGFVRRVRDDVDRRRVMVETTPELMRRSAPVYGPLVEEGSREMATYSLDELEVILDFLERNRRLLAKHTARIHELIAEREAGASKTG